MATSRRIAAHKTFPSVLEPSLNGRGMAFAPETLTHIPAQAKLRPLRDNLIIEPNDQALSSIIMVIHKTKPLKGIVKAVGPGTWVLGYMDKDGNKIPDWDRKRRAKVYETKTFRPTEIKVGDEVELGGQEHNGYAFDAFVWGEKIHLYGAREADVCAVHS